MLKFSVKRYLQYLYSGETHIACLLLLVEVSPIQQDWRDSVFSVWSFLIFTLRGTCGILGYKKSKSISCVLTKYFSFMMLLISLKIKGMFRIVAVAVLLSQVLIVVSLCNILKQSKSL